MRLLERFAAPPRRPRQDTLEVLNGPEDGRTFELHRSDLTIGRQEDCEIHLGGDPTLSRHHARLVHAGGWGVEELGARHRTTVNGEPLEGSRSLADGDELLVGSTLLGFETAKREP